MLFTKVATVFAILGLGSPGVSTTVGPYARQAKAVREDQSVCIVQSNIHRYASFLLQLANSGSSLGESRSLPVLSTPSVL